jgi:hypothetical protein
MNIAFPALFVLLLLLPGVLLHYSYRRGFFQRSPVTLGPVRDEVGRGIVLALLVHPAALLVVWASTGWSPDAEVLASVFAGIGDVGAEEATRQFASGLAYLVGSNIGALALGWLIHWVVRYNHLDLRWDRLRFNNEWHYLFSGEARVFTVEQEERTIASIKEFLSWDAAFVFVSVVVNHGEDSVLYWGILSDYFFNRAGRLERIVLTDAQRRPLREESDRQPPSTQLEEGQAMETPIVDERFYPIRGAYFVIQYDNVQTLNVEYYQVYDEE